MVSGFPEETDEEGKGMVHFLVHAQVWGQAERQCRGQ